MSEVHVVKYIESERGWGGEVWFTPYQSYTQALKAVEDCNKENPTTHVPDYYICAEYIGKREESQVPEGYKT